MATSAPKDSQSVCEATTVTSSSSSSAASVASLDLPEPEDDMPKPFFIMDWLEKVDSRALEKAQRMLQSSNTPKKTKSFPKKPANNFLKRSISMGNGWNAKGLQRAQNGKWEDALRCWINALEIRTQILGEDHIDTANTANNIGIALGKLNRIDEAILYLKQALEIRIHHFGRENSQVAATYHNLGNVFQQGGLLEEAVNCFHESKKLQEKILGPYHVEVARSYVSMGHTYVQAEQYRDAREAYRDALYVFQRAGLLKENMEVQAVLADVRDLDQLLHLQDQV